MDIANIFQFIIDIFSDFLTWIVDKLPNSPFLALSTTPIAEWLPYINYFLPFDFIIDTIALWLLAVTGYYTYFVLMRLFKMIS